LNCDLAQLASEFQHYTQPNGNQYNNVAKKLISWSQRVEKLRLLFEKYGPGYSIPLCFKRRCQVLKAELCRQSELIRAMQYDQPYVVSVARLFAAHVGRFTAKKEAHHDRFATECDGQLDFQDHDIIFAPHCGENENQHVLLQQLRYHLDLEVERCQCQLCLKGLYRDMLRTSLLEPLRDATPPFTGSRN
jgi:hypothetical protein